ncbi:hypothetical protein AAFF_G00110280 [Aldrovandia affinis]|uniref:Uncharacterized protein n=1 Tax=Aldrovandia affinis TaxID=143900 RepID=A0AAD7RTL7_9TELE|nr:hypothetical protein AAFF_G00110280 [Aldrovandia affinis]
MYVTRPKSSKGRSRPTLNHAKSADVSAYRNPPMAPRPPSAAPDQAEHSARSHPLLRQSSVMSAEEVAKLLQSVPTPPALSLNKYRVLPSIERKSQGGESFQGLEEKTSKLSLSDNLVVQSRRGHREQQLSLFRTRAASGATRRWAARRRRLTQGPGPQRQTALQRPSLIVLAAAEARYGTRYERGVVETMDVPRRSFADLTMTLAQCGIHNRSVLCISRQEDGSTDST